MDTKTKDKLLSRRDFLSGLKKWSKVVIAGAVGISLGSRAHAHSWVNRYGGGGWANGGVVWGNGGTIWGNSGGSWGNGGGSWGNSGGGSWVNRYGGGGWINRR